VRLSKHPGMPSVPLHTTLHGVFTQNLYLKNLGVLVVEIAVLVEFERR
jgi:hypothetical protein